MNVMKMSTQPALESGLAKLADSFDAAYEAEWERVAEIAEGAGASGVADRAATIAGIRAVHAALLAKIEAADDVMTCIAVVNRIQPLPLVVLELIAQYRAALSPPAKEPS